MCDSTTRDGNTEQLFNAIDILMTMVNHSAAIGCDLELEDGGESGTAGRGEGGIEFDPRSASDGDANALLRGNRNAV